MQTIIVAKEFDRITAETTGETIKVEFESKQWQHIFVRHISGEIICGLSDKISGNANGVTKLKSGGARFDPPVPVVYIGGVGVCEIIVSNFSAFPFNSSAEGGTENVEEQQYFWFRRVNLKAGTITLVEFPPDATGDTAWITNLSEDDVWCSCYSNVQETGDGTITISKDMEHAYPLCDIEASANGLYLLSKKDGAVNVIIVPKFKNPLYDPNCGATILSESWSKALYND